jgi:peroxiredoxin
MSKRAHPLLPGAVALAALAAVILSRAEAPPTNVGRTVADFRLRDTTGKTVALSDFKNLRAVVVVFIGTECPINNAYMPTLAELHRRFGGRGVQFLAVNANTVDTAGDVARHARKHRIPFPVLRDDGTVADRFGARRTPEAFLLDGGRVIRYQGRIDDQFGVGYKRPKPTRRDLAEAIEDVLAGKHVRVPTRPVAGCALARVRQTSPLSPGGRGVGGEGMRSAVTYTKDIARILQKNCQECHRPGQIGPMPLLSYEDAAAWADTIRDVLRDGRMPPWGADPRYGKFSNDRRLAAADRQALLRWIEGGTPRGDDRDLPLPRQFVAGWRIGKPDLVVRMPEEYAVRAEMPKLGVPYQHFTVDPGFTQDRWVVRAEARSGASEVVHHILVFVVPPGEHFWPGNPHTPVLCGTAPGDSPTVTPAGTAKRIPAGSKLVFEMHYTPNGRAQQDRSCIGLVFAKSRPRHVVQTEPIANISIEIPAGAPNYEAEAWFRFRQDGHVVGLMPHMHLRGKDFRFEAVYPDGKRETLLSVPHFDFNWQSGYHLAEPKAMPRGTRIHCVAHYDNSAGNASNPDPTKAVTWGDQTWDEMLVGWMDYYYDADRSQGRR